MEANPPKEETSQQINLIGVRVTLTFFYEKRAYLCFLYVDFVYLFREKLTRDLGFYHNIFRKLWKEKNFSIYLLQRSL